MNELLRDLAEQSIIYKSNGQGNDIPKPVFNKEKFAHLIIQECANLLVKEAKSSHDEGSETYDTLIRESNWMKRYFGVE